MAYEFLHYFFTTCSFPFGTKLITKITYFNALSVNFIFDAGLGKFSQVGCFFFPVQAPPSNSQQAMQTENTGLVHHIRQNTPVSSQGVQHSQTSLL